MEPCPLCGETHSLSSHLAVQGSGETPSLPFPPGIIALPLSIPPQLATLLAQVMGGGPPRVGRRTHFMDRPLLKGRPLNCGDAIKPAADGVVERLLCRKCGKHTTVADCLWDYVLCTDCDMALTTNGVVLESMAS